MAELSTDKVINIRFPFKDSQRGYYFDLTTDDNSAFKSNLIHLLLTRKGERYYKPDFGTNLLKFIFEPNDSITHSDIREDISNAMSKYFPNVKINSINIDFLEGNELTASVKLDYTIIEDIFQNRDSITINI